MTKSELVEVIASKKTDLLIGEVEASVKLLLQAMTDALSEGGRIEIRGFGSFSLHHRAARQGRNPKTGESVLLKERMVPHFKPGKALRECVDF